MKKFAIALVIMLATSVIGMTIVWKQLDAPLTLGAASLEYSVEPGDSLNGVLHDLSKQQILAHTLALKLYARLSGQTAIKAGEYELTANMTHRQLLDELYRGHVIQRYVTLVEGRTFRQALAALQQAPKLKQTLRGLSDQQILKTLGIAEKHPEGLFFPDTYQYTSQMSDADILRQAYQRMQQVLAEEWDQRDGGLPYKSGYEVLIMASIVEKETGVPEERSAIAGVFVRRLQNGMKLQTDPTVIYGLGDTYKGNITRKHLQQDTPWNTYTRYGLPPTPIALPGREAIHAALHPEQGSSLYFVGRGDGHHYFSSTLAEHEKAVREYQLSRKKDYRSAPP